MTLEQAYLSIKDHLPKTPIDSLEVVRQVEEYRQFWKPEHVNAILLAESHVYTNDTDYKESCNKAMLDSFVKNYPVNFVRFIYCLAYGESSLLNRAVEDNFGTPQYWKIFSSCIAKNESELNFHRLKKADIPFVPRLVNKVNILQEMKRRGIWLIDASIVGIYRGSIDDPEIKATVIRDSWDCYLKDVILQAKPKDIIVIGKGVAKSLNCRLKTASSQTDAKCTVLPQPQGNRGSSEQQLETYREYQRICSKYT
jgi:hypothetical protein